MQGPTVSGRTSACPGWCGESVLPHRASSHPTPAPRRRRRGNRHRPRAERLRRARPLPTRGTRPAGAAGSKGRGPSTELTLQTPGAPEHARIPVSAAAPGASAEARTSHLPTNPERRCLYRFRTPARSAGTAPHRQGAPAGGPLPTFLHLSGQAAGHISGPHLLWLGNQKPANKQDTTGNKPNRERRSKSQSQTLGSRVTVPESVST